MKVLDLTSGFLNRHRHLIVFLSLWAIVSLVLYLRFPNNVTSANFYAEDGSVFLQNILDKGWLEALVSPFNGYFVSGLYILCGLGWAINLLFGGELITLAQSFAIAAILFMSFVLSLPYLLLRSQFSATILSFVVILSSLIPLPASPHVVIGTIGNQKWIFLYLAFLLILYQVYNYKKLSKRKLALVGFGVFICAYTNSVTYFLMPLLILPFVLEFLSKKQPRNFLVFAKKQASFNYTRGVLLLAITVFPQVVYVLINGIPKMTGYLDGAFQSDKAIELFINRTYLFGFTANINEYLNDWIVVGTFTVLIFLAIRYLNSAGRIAFAFAVYSAGVASLLFAINRPGVTEHLLGYSPNGSGPDQFFYAQTLVLYLPITLLIFSLVSKIKIVVARRIISVLIAGVLLGSGLYSNMVHGELWRNASVFENSSSTFTDQAIISCIRSSSAQVSIPLYPSANGQFVLNVPREEVCNKLGKYQLSHDYLGLTLNNNDYITLTSGTVVHQSFIATQNKLDGIRIFISTFGKTERTGNYILEIMDNSCDRTIRQATIPNRLADNSYYNLRFDPINGSLNNRYCFSIRPSGSLRDAIALQRSPASQYREGTLVQDGQVSDSDLVFEPLYVRER